jgi:hypothetical protein
MYLLISKIWLAVKSLPIYRTVKASHFFDDECDGSFRNSSIFSTLASRWVGRRFKLRCGRMPFLVPVVPVYTDFNIHRHYEFDKFKQSI